MTDLTPELGLDAIDEWFKIGKKSVQKSLKTVPRSVTHGRYFDLSTQKPRVAETENTFHLQRRTPAFSQTDYAEAYRKQEEEELMGYTHPHQANRTTSIANDLEHLDLDSIATSTVAIPHDLVPSNAMDVYKNYNFEHHSEGNLPIAEHKDEVIGTIESNQVTIVQGATGSGKTTQVPQYILDNYAKMGRYCNIIVTQPRRIAAMSIARRVCSERKWQLGTICGYQVGMDKQASEDTRILYVTTGVLLRKLVSKKNMLEYTHVILDEVHERDQDTDFSLLIVRKLLRTNSRHVKVVLMSATFDCDLFAQYFALPVRDRLEPAPVVTVDEAPHSVSEYYVEDIKELGQIPELHPYDPSISKESYSLAARLIEEFDKMEVMVQGRYEDRNYAKYRGTVLVFLPGMVEIDDMHDHLMPLERSNLKIIPLHSTITVEEQSKVFDIPENGQRKVILSTNIAESSITVPDIRYVIDFCLTKNLISDNDTNYTSLQVEWASKANCIQRKGRAGRVSNGRVYRMVRRDFYETVIPSYGIPEMQRCPLEKLVLQTKVFNMGEPKALLALALEPPNLDDIEKTILLLKEVGALSTPATGEGNRHDGQLTFVGHVLADLPVDIKIGKLLIYGHVFGVLEECLIIGAAMSLKSLFSKPYKAHLESYRHKLDWARGSQSDSLAILNAYKEYETRKNMGEFRRGVSEREWCKRHFLQQRRLREISELVRELEQRLNQFNISKPSHRPNYKNRFTEDQERLLLKLVMCGAFYPNYFLKGQVDEESALREMSGNDPLNTVMVKGLPANQGMLYKQALEDQFRHVGFNPEAVFEETRAYVSFQWKPEYRGSVHPGVYMAVKLRQLRQSITIEQYSTDQAHKLLQEIQSRQTNEAGRLRSNRHERIDQRAQMALPDLSKKYVSLFISSVVECGHFWAQYDEDSRCGQLNHIQAVLNSTNLAMCRAAPVGQIVAAPYTDQGETQYYRARIDSYGHQKRQERRIEVAMVFFVDFGNSEMVDKSSLRICPPDILSIPYQAVECFLCEIRPSVRKCPDSKWTREATDLFRSWTDQQFLFGQVYSTVRGTIRLDLIQSLGNGRQVSFREELINLGFGERAEENYLSKKDHEQRQSPQVIRPQEERVRSSGDWVGAAISGASPLSAVPLTKTRGQKLYLKGPSNPYEMQLYSLTNVGRLRAAKVDPDSVNSVAIDDEPESPHARLMIAGFVGLNAAGSTMIARDTTIMPLIPGLPALVSLLFCPIAELRVDQRKENFIGAICGLGLDEFTGEPAMPDHDMEVAFDTRITLEDILKINGVRMAINIVLGSEQAVSNWGEDAIYKLQDSARQKLMRLIQETPREPFDAPSPERPYRWNQLDPADILGHELQNTPADSLVLLHLHKGVCLQTEREDEEDEEEELGVEEETLEMRRHVDWLHQAAKSSTSREPILCRLCNMTWQTPQLLQLHLETRRHKDKENGLYD
uniref:ATP-dependent RNA helicase TDRD9 n=1 Tax=Crassostrea virginica TaxID=6565 RepID=A0A8B8DY81_CRAVI|nr:putative ATP-dependent RNA helicase TDRD9 [Crassostrea virginica]